MIRVRRERNGVVGGGGRIKYLKKLTTINSYADTEMSILHILRTGSYADTEMSTLHILRTGIFKKFYCHCFSGHF